jgi:elongation factor 1-alpha
MSVRESLRHVVKGRGTVAGTVDNPPSVARRFEAEVTVFDEVTVRPGHQFTMHTHVDKVPVTVLSIRRAAKSIDGTGEGAGDEVGHEPIEHLRADEWALVEFEALRPVALDEADRLAPLSRIVLRVSNKPIGCGRCLRILE